MILVLLYPAAVWALYRSLTGHRDKTTVVCASAVALAGAAGVAAVAKDAEWPPDQGLVVALVFWALPLSLAVVALARAASTRSRPKR